MLPEPSKELLGLGLPGWRQSAPQRRQSARNRRLGVTGAGRKLKTNAQACLVPPKRRLMLLERSKRLLEPAPGQLNRSKWLPGLAATQSAPEMAARACPGATRALEMDARACPGAAKALDIAARAGPGAAGAPEIAARALSCARVEGCALLLEESARSHETLFDYTRCALRAWIRTESQLYI